MTHKLKARLKWVKLYAETKNAGLVCRRCDISRPTLRKWWRRFQKSGQDGLEDLSRRPKSSQNRKIFEKEIKLVSELRKRRLGSRRIQSELLRNWCLFSNGYRWRILQFQMFQSSQPRNSRFLTRLFFQPGNTSPDIDGGGGRQIMEMRFPLADISASP